MICLVPALWRKAPIRPPGSRRAVYSRPRLTQCAVWAKASPAHHHPGIRTEGRNANRLRNYGRLEPVASTRAVCCQHFRLQNEYPRRPWKRPRFSKHTFAGCDVSLENRFSGNVRNELTAKGHKIDLRGSFSGVMGGGQAVMRDFRYRSKLRCLRSPKRWRSCHRISA